MEKLFTQDKLFANIAEEKRRSAMCEHKSCGNAEKVWLPYVFMGRECGYKPHPYCTECGAVKNLSSQRPREIGFYVNLVVALSKSYRIAQVQMRLIALEMEMLELDDKYALDRLQQEKLFVKIIRKFVNVPENALFSLLEG
jgi:hypothetical protein